MMRFTLGSITLLVLSLAMGCQRELRSYEVTVRNESVRPVTVLLTKNGPGTFDPHWKPADQPGAASGSTVIQPSSSVSTGKVDGSFAAGVDAILRVYPEPQAHNEQAAASTTQPTRTEVILQPGVNQVLVSDSGTGINADRVQP